MKKSIINKIIWMGIFVIFTLVSCRLEVPVKEMSEAKLNISRAIEVKSEKYAPELLKNAQDELIKSHDKIKTEDVKNAKKNAEESKKYSDEAIAKSLPLLADETLKEARNVLDMAAAADAGKYDPENFTEAGKNIQEAEKFFQDGEYWDSYLKSLDAMNNANIARNKSIGNAEALREKIKNMQAESEDLKAHGANESAPDEIKTVETNLQDAGLLITSNNLKDANERITDAEEALKSAAIKTWKAYAAEKLASAENAKSEADKSPAKETFAKDLERSGVLLAESKELFGKEDYRGSASRSEEVLSILNSMKIAEEKTNIEEGQGAEKDSGVVINEKTAEVIIYIVKYDPKNRDCLWRIAENSYKDAKLWPLIYVANKDQIKDPDLIFPGQKFVIPPVPKKAEDIIPAKSTNTGTDNNVKDKPAEKAVTPGKTEINGAPGKESSSDKENTDSK